MTAHERELIDIFASWARTALHDGAHPVGLVLLSPPDANGDRLPALYSVPDDPGCEALLSLLCEIVEQVRAGFAMGVPLGEEVPQWFREGRTPSSAEVPRRGVCLLCGESHAPAVPCAPSRPV